MAILSDINLRYVCFLTPLPPKLGSFDEKFDVFLLIKMAKNIIFSPVV